jgi:2-succinyl-6-hydroxy-2,4-cyclohexadiene-1-carboxylate synthase
VRTTDNLNYEVCGDHRDPVVLFLHGFMGSSADWRDGMAAIGNLAFCIAFDLPGHGASLELAPEVYTIEGSARAVIHTLDQLDIERPAMAGYSMGGRLALYLALRYPDRCAGLFLESASPGLQSAEERRARRAERLESGDFEQFLSDWYGQPLFAPLARDEDLLQQTIATRRRNDPVELARSLRGMGAGNQSSLWGELGGLAVPALAVAGELDEKYATISSCMATVNPRIESELVRGVGHNVHTEAPAEYVAMLGCFLNGLPRALGEVDPVP